jgi:predicted enzyme related to lactoylglutathione lyase
VGQVKPVLYVSDVEASAPYFEKTLGFEFLGYTLLEGRPYYADMAAGSLKFGLHNPLTGQQTAWVGHQRLYFRVRDVHAYRALVLANGGLPGDIIETDWMDMVIVQDPDGHELVFAETDSARHSVNPW